MIYIGMDVSSKSFMIHAINERKKVVFRGEIQPTREGLRRLNEDLGAERKLYVFESGNQLKWISDVIKKMGGHQHVVHPNEVKWIVGSTGKKTDKVDARKLAELARMDMLPRPVVVAEGKERKLRELVAARSNLKSKKIALVNAIQGYVKQEGRKLPKGFFKNEEWTLALEKLKISENTKFIIASFMNALEAMALSEKELLEAINGVEDERVELIKTVPAIGDLTARVVLAALINAKRFDNSKAVANFGALTPTIYQSGDVLRMGHINRDGRQEVRHVLLQCAHTITRMKSPEVKPLKEFFERIQKRKGKKTAVVALARKLLTTIYGVLKSGEVYDPARLKAA